MMRLIYGFLTALLLAACGADGEPLTPSYRTETTIGYNSTTGAFNRTVFSVEIGG